MAAVLVCGAGAALSHEDAAALYGLCAPTRRRVNVSVPGHRKPNPTGVIVHRRPRLRPGDITPRAAIPVTSIALTLVDLAGSGYLDVEQAVNEADKRDLIDPEALRATLSGFARIRGAGRLAKLLDRRTFTLTDSQLERRFIPIALRAGLPRPLTQQWLDGFRVDFWWPDLGLVVETDSLTYHRTPFEQTIDRRRDQAHTAAGRTQLRFSRAQVRFEPNHVEEILARVARRLRA